MQVNLASKINPNQELHTMQNHINKLTGVSANNYSQTVTLSLEDNHIEIHGFAAPFNCLYKDIRSVTIKRNTLIIQGHVPIAVRLDMHQNIYAFVNVIQRKSGLPNSQIIHENQQLRNNSSHQNVQHTPMQHDGTLPRFQSKAPNKAQPAHTTDTIKPAHGNKITPPRQSPFSTTSASLGATNTSQQHNTDQIPGMDKMPPAKEKTEKTIAYTLERVMSTLINEVVWLKSDWILIIASSIAILISTIAAGIALGVVNSLVLDSSPSTIVRWRYSGPLYGFFVFWRTN